MTAYYASPALKACANQPLPDHWDIRWDICTSAQPDATPAGIELVAMMERTWAALHPEPAKRTPWMTNNGWLR